MGFLDRLLNKPATPSVTRRTVPELGGAMTARQAWAVVAPTAKAMDPQARLTLVTSGLDISAAGRSLTWEFAFFLPARNASVLLSVEPDPQAADVDTSPCVLTQRNNQATAIDASRPAFPEEFRDSPDAVADFSAAGVDFVAGPGDMKLEGRMLPSGESVWITRYWDKEFSTPFEARGD